MTYDKITIELTNYKKEFWNLMMKGTKGNYENLKGGKISNEMFVLPYDSNKKYNELISDECVFRRIATNIKANDSDHTLFVSDSDDVAEWNLTNIEDIKNVINNFTKKRMECHTLSIITRLDENIVHDSQFDTEDYLIKHFAKSFGKAEENAFINGTGVNMPIGILNRTDGA